MFKDEFYSQLTRDVTRVLAPTLAEQLAASFKLPVSMSIADASRWTGISRSMLRDLYRAGVITGRQTGTGDNSPIILHTTSVLQYIGIKESKEYILSLIKTIAA